MTGDVHRWECEGGVRARLEDEARRRLKAYRAQPRDIEEHYAIERHQLDGAYGNQQLRELVQNAFDATFAGTDLDAEHRIQVSLTRDYLYVANTGQALSYAGIDALLSSQLSPKSGEQIGRFGLGFKSVLRLSDAIDIYSHGASLRFDRDRAHREISAALDLPSDARIASLRVAWPAPVADELERDQTLRDLSAWATTVVRLRLRDHEAWREAHKQLGAAFPFESLLLTQRHIELALQIDAVANEASSLRSASVEKMGEERVLVVREGEEETRTRWRVFSRELELPETLRQEIEESLYARASRRITWAAPVEGRRLDRGKFCAYFPLEQRSPVPGLLDAAWQTNNDRQNLLATPYNAEIIASFASLIASALPQLASEADPGFSIELLPRQETEGLAARLRDRIVYLAPGLQIVPRASSTLSSWKGTSFPPARASRPETGQRLQELWTALVPEDEQNAWLHWSVAIDRERRARAHAIFCLSENPADSSLESWLEQVRAHDLDSSLAALRFLGELAIHLSSSKPQSVARIGTRRGVRERNLQSESLQQVARKLPIVWTSSGEAKAATDGVFMPHRDIPLGVHVVHEALVEDSVARSVLESLLSVGELSAEAWLRWIDDAHAAAHNSSQAAEWEELWRVLGLAPSDVAERYLERAVTDRAPLRELRVLAADGGWKHTFDVLRTGGAIAPLLALRPDLKSLLVHPSHQQRFTRLLNAAGVGDEPSCVRSEKARRNEWSHYAEFERLAFDYVCFYRNVSGRSSPASPDYLRADPAEPLPVPFVGLLEGSAAEAMTIWALDHADLLQLQGDVCMQHRSWGAAENADLARHRLPRPVVVPLWRSGALHGMRLAIYASLQRSEWARLLPPLAPHQDRAVRAIARGAETLWGEREFRVGVDELKEILRILDGSGGASPELLSSYYDRLACSSTPDQWTPERVWYGEGLSAKIEDIRVSGDPQIVALSQQLPVLLLRSPVARDRFVRAGAMRLQGTSSPAWEARDAPAPLLEVAWELRDIPGADEWEGVQLFFCDELRLEFEGHPPIPQDLLVERDEVLVDARAFAGGRDAILRQLAIKLAELSHALNSDQIIDGLARGSIARRRAQVAAAPTAEGRLLAALSGSVETLEEELSEAESAALQDQEATPEAIARLFLALHGPESLYRLHGRGALDGLDPPSKWGTLESEHFVEELGFDRSWGEQRRTGRREAYEEVIPLAPLGPLHDFQVPLYQELRDLFDRDTGQSALLSLPTGAGKTRISVEALIRGPLSNDDPALVIWIADRDELCEQSLACFAHLWAHHGREGRRLRLSRLWGGNTARVVPSNDPHVVVASIQTLSGLAGSRDFEWLREASAVVVDEAHHYPAKSYRTVIDRWLLRGIDGESPPALLGLSATPFRSSSSRESAKIVERFKILVPRESEQLQLRRSLTETGVLAEAHFVRLATHIHVALDAKDQWHVREFSALPASFQSRLGKDAERNRALLNLLRALDHESVLVFASSVYQARWLAAALNLGGDSAAAVVGETGRGVRQSFVEEFREGRLRFVTTHTVLATGFDAPKADAVVIARPTFSRVLYLQMVGRGLRGPLNGGSATCSIYTVVDNLNVFGDKLEDVLKEAQAAWATEPGEPS